VVHAVSPSQQPISKIESVMDETSYVKRGRVAFNSQGLFSRCGMVTRETRSRTGARGLGLGSCTT